MAHLRKCNLLSLCKGFSYTEWGYSLWMSYAMGLIIVYGTTYRWTWPLQVGCLLGGFVGFLLLRCAYRKRCLVVFPAIVLCLVGVFGAYRMHHTITTFTAQSPFYIGQEGQYLCYVTEMPERCQWGAETVWRCTGAVQQVQGRGKKQTAPLPAGGHIYFYLHQKELQLLPGTYVLVRGTPQAIRELEAEGTMDRRCRTMSEDLRGTMYDAQLIHVYPNRQPNGQSYRIQQRVAQGIGAIRYAIHHRLQDNLPAQVAFLCESLLLGGNYQSIDRTVMQSFSTTGLIHILSVSGSHIALLFGCIYAICHQLHLRLRTTVGIGIGCIVAYGCLVGGNPPIIRASLMGILTAIALLEGRTYSAKQALSLSALGLLLYDPCMLFDISFQLSLGATYGILLCGKTIYRALPSMPIWIKGSVALCLAAQILIWPWQIYYFHRMNPISLVASVCVAPLLDIVIIGTVALLMLSCILSVSWLWWLLRMLVTFAIGINVSLTKVPYGSVWVRYLPVSMTLCWYALVALGMYGHRQTALWWKRVGTSACCLGILLSYVPSYVHAHTDRIHVIPLTQGAAFLILHQEATRTYSFLYVNTLGKELSPGNLFRIQNDIHYFGIQTLTALYEDGMRSGTVAKLLGYMAPSANSVYCLGRVHGDLKEGTLRGFHGEGKEDRVTVSLGHRSIHLVRAEEGPISMIYPTEKGVFIFCHGQKIENTLKLNKKPPLVVGTMDAKTAYRMAYGTKLPAKRVWYWPTRGAGEDMDPADARIYTVGRRYVADME